MAKDILVIGGNSGIGLETVRLLAEQGSRITAALRSPDALESIEGVAAQRFDVTADDAELDLPEAIDGLVYFPGTISLKPFPRFTDADFEQDWRINFLGATRVIRQALPALKKADRASIVLFSTVAVQTGLPFHASIAAAKGAVEGLTRSLAAELAPGIRVNAIAPSLTDTPLASSLLGSEDKAEASAKRHPLKRVGDAREIARMVTFLLGEDSGFITGQVIGIDGGFGSLRGM